MCLLIRHNFANCAHTIEQEVICQPGLCGRVGLVRSHHQGSCSECSGISPYGATRQTRIRPGVLMAESKGLDAGSDNVSDDRADSYINASDLIHFVLPDDDDNNHDLNDEDEYCSSDNGHARASSFARYSLADSRDQIPHSRLPSGKPTSNSHTEPLGNDSNNGPVRDTMHICKDATDSNWYSCTFKVNKNVGFKLGDPFTVPDHDEALAEAGDDLVCSMHGAISPDEVPEPASHINSNAAHALPNNMYGWLPISVCQGRAYASVPHFYLQSPSRMTYAYTPQQLPEYVQPAWVPSPYPVGALLPPGPAPTFPPPCLRFHQLRRRGGYSHIRNGDGH